MLAIAGLVVALQLAAIYTPLRGFLDLEPMGAVDLAVCIAAGVVMLATLEAAKVRHRRTLAVTSAASRADRGGRGSAEQPMCQPDPQSSPSANPGTHHP